MGAPHGNKNAAGKHKKAWYNRRVSQGEKDRRISNYIKLHRKAKYSVPINKLSAKAKRRLLSSVMYK